MTPPVPPLPAGWPSYSSCWFVSSPGVSSALSNNILIISHITVRTTCFVISSSISISLFKSITTGVICVFCSQFQLIREWYPRMKVFSLRREEGGGVALFVNKIIIRPDQHNDNCSTRYVVMSVRGQSRTQHNTAYLDILGSLQIRRVCYTMLRGNINIDLNENNVKPWTRGRLYRHGSIRGMK